MTGDKEAEGPLRSPTTNPLLHELKPVTLEQPLLHSIPPELMPRFDPVYAEYYNKYYPGRLATYQIPIEELRANPLKYTISYGTAPGPDVYRITEQQCPVTGGEITVRIFEPVPVLDSNGEPKKRGVYINYHGGGWVLGSLAAGHDFCKSVVHGCNGAVVVVDVDYRLAPENKYPIPIDDCWAAYNWVRTEKAKELNIDTNRIAIGGISAGGHLAAVVAHLCRDNNLPLRFQLLTVPVIDMHSSFTPEWKFDRENTPYESYREMEFTAALTPERMEYFGRQFLGVPRPALSSDDWKISPILAPSFANLAPALIHTAELDPLRDEGEAYAAKLKAAGVEVELIRVPRVAHNFVHMTAILEQSKLYNQQAIAALSKALGW